MNSPAALTIRACHACEVVPIGSVARECTRARCGEQVNLRSYGG